MNTDATVCACGYKTNKTRVMYDHLTIKGNCPVIFKFPEKAIEKATKEAQKKPKGTFAMLPQYWNTEEKFYYEKGKQAAAEEIKEMLTDEKTPRSFWNEEEHEPEWYSIAEWAKMIEDKIQEKYGNRPQVKSSSDTSVGATRRTRDSGSSPQLADTSSSLKFMCLCMEKGHRSPKDCYAAKKRRTK